MIFSSRPDVSVPDPSSMMDLDGTSFVPSPLARYHQILFPALRLCQALLASLGGANRSAAAQVRHFVTSNEEMVRAILKNRQSWSLSHLQELSLLTGVVSRAFSAEDDDGSATSAADMERSAHASRVRRLMLSLVPICDLSEDAVRQVKAGVPEKSRGQAFTHLLEVVQNVATFALKAVAGASTRGTGAKFFQVVFSPSLSEARERGESEYYQSGVVFPNRPPSLGHLLVLVQNLVNVLLTGHSELTDLRGKLATVEHLSSGELSALLASSLSSSGVYYERLSASDKRSLASGFIRGAVRTKEHEERLAGGALEAAGFLCLRHLEYFLLHSSAEAPISSYQKAHRRIMGKFLSLFYSCCFRCW